MKISRNFRVFNRISVVYLLKVKSKIKFSSMVMFSDVLKIAIFDMFENFRKKFFFLIDVKHRGRHPLRGLGAREGVWGGCVAAAAAAAAADFPKRVTRNS